MVYILCQKTSLRIPTSYFKPLRVERGMIDGERKGGSKYSRKVGESEKSWETWKIFYCREKEHRF
jgi:hypothetical protein